jgi:hypothetical protein
MKKRRSKRNGEELRQEYDFASMKNEIQGKYASRFRQATNVVLLEPDVAEAFPTDKAVNEALRGILDITRSVRRRTVGK